MRYAVRWLLPCLLCVSGLAWGQDKSPAKEDETPDVVFVGTPYDVVSKMLKMADVKKDDVVYDLGCGDGRIVALAARKYGCQGIGFDINPVRIKEAKALVEAYNVNHLVKIEKRNIFAEDISKASVVTLYLLPELNLKLVPQLNKMKPGSRIVSHEYGMRGIEPKEKIHFRSREDNTHHTIYLWVTPLKVSEKFKEETAKEEKDSADKDNSDKDGAE